MVGGVKKGKKKWRIMRVFARKDDLEKILREMENWTDERKEGVRTIVERNFNARTGREGGGVEEKGDCVKGRGRG